MYKILPILALALLLSACGSTKEIIKIGYSGPLTGDVAVAGNENLRGIQLAIDKINAEGGIDGKNIVLSVKDDRFIGKETITQYQQLTQIEGVDFVVTSTYGGYLALASQAEKDNVILLESLDTSEEFSDLSENAFAIGIYDESIGFSIADYFNDRNIQQIGVITNIDDPFMGLVRDAFVHRYSGEFQEEKYSFSTVEFQTILSKLDSYDHVALFGFEETGMVVRQARELGLNTKFIGIDTLSSEDFRQNTGGNFEGILFTFWEGSEENEIYQEMLSDYKIKHGALPENVLFVATGYDAMLVLGNALKTCKDDVDCVKVEIGKTKNYPGAAGSITMDEDHITRSIRETIHTYKDGEIIPVN